MSDFEFEIAELKKKIEELEGKKDKIPSYQYSKIRDIDLRKLVDIEESTEDKIFNEWFNNKITINKETIDFLKKLLRKEEKNLKNYNEEDLKMKFLSILFHKIDFQAKEYKFRDFYEYKLTYKTDNFIFTGTTDFLISKGLRFPEKPYFFIQEFKKGRENSDPEPQLLAELISAVELNGWETIKGAYIIGENWNFVILNRFEKHKYEYFVSRTFNSTNFEDLKGIFKNLLFVKQEIIEMVKNGD